MQKEDLHGVKQFKCLGLTVQADGGSEKEVTKRVQAGWRGWKKITGVMCDKKVPEGLKGRLSKVMVRPALLHGMETVAVTKRQEKRWKWQKWRC